MNGKPGADKRRQPRAFVHDIEQHASWDTWAEKLISRKKPVAIRKLVSDQATHPLAWSIDDRIDSASVEAINQLDGLRKKRRAGEPADWSAVVEEWYQRVDEKGTANLSFATECVAWANSLSYLAPRMGAECWWDLFNFLLETAREAVGSYVVDTKHNDAELSTIGQLLTAELPMTLGYWFPKIDICSELATAGRESLNATIVELLDGEGMPHARFLSQSRQLLASWTRSLFIDRHLRGNRIKSEARLQFEWFVRQTLRLVRNDGSFAFDQGLKNTRKGIGRELISAALKVGGDEADVEIFERLNAKGSVSKNGHLPNPSEHSEWAELAILRSDWSRNSAFCVVGFNDATVRTELAIADTVLLSGQDIPELTVDGQPANIESTWEEVCWESDDDIDYVELEATYDNGIKVQRQVLLAREDRFFFTADAIVGNSNANMDYKRVLPFTNAISAKSADETREESLHAKRRIGTVMPLALPEWRVSSHRGEYKNGRLRQSTKASGMYCPVFIDLDEKRKRRSITWRQLTVAEKLEIVGPEVAVAFRIQIGDENWIVYRSIAKPANRTFLGQNHTTEFLVARFVEGELELLIEVQ